MLFTEYAPPSGLLCVISLVRLEAPCLHERSREIEKEGHRKRESRTENNKEEGGGRSIGV